MIELVYTDNGLIVNLSKAERVMPVLLQRWMVDVLAHLHRSLNENIGDGGFVGRRSGALARSLLEKITVTTDGITGEIWPDPAKVPYGTIQETGGTIVPKNARMLAIPLSAMLTGNGVARGTAAQVKASPEAFGFTSTFIARKSSVIMGVVAGGKGRLGKAGTVIPLFALKASVTIPATHYLSHTLTQAAPFMAARLEALYGEMVSVLFDDGAAYA